MSQEAHNNNNNNNTNPSIIEENVTSASNQTALFSNSSEGVTTNGEIEDNHNIKSPEEDTVADGNVVPEHHQDVNNDSEEKNADMANEDEDDDENEDVEYFVNTLESFKDLKSGISGSRIKKLTTFALDNINLEDKFVKQIISYSKTCPNTHKLGSLYIIDSIGRAFLDEVRNNNDHVNERSKIGTCAHAIYVIGENIKDLLTDAIAKSDEDNREKIRTLIDIWDRTGLFQKSALNAVRSKSFSMELSNKSGGNNQHSTNSNLKRNSFDLGNNINYNAKIDQILNNLEPIPNLPQFKYNDKIESQDITEQTNNLRKLLVSIHKHLNTESTDTEIPTSSSKQSYNDSHRPTEYGSRRDREQQHDGNNRYSSRRNRSRSPPRRDHVHNNQQQHNRQNQNGPLNNHHLYPEEMNVPQNPHFRPRQISYDPTLPKEQVKILSRTIFIGGVPNTMKEWDIANVLRQFAEVQSVILNSTRKHAFVKVYSRNEAENVLANFNKDGSSPLRTRWGVGFGPRDCCNYQYGYSVIPIHRLTESDKKWSLEAQWGGTGGQPLTSGMVFEEPDIIVGDVVSTKNPHHGGGNSNNAHNGHNRRHGNRYGNNNNNNNNNNRNQNSYNSSNQMYGQMNQGGYMPNNDMYGNPMGNNPIATSNSMGNNYQASGPMGMPPPQQPQPQGPPTASQQGSDAQAQLNTLMSMLNQQ